MEERPDIGRPEGEPPPPAPSAPTAEQPQQHSREPLPQREAPEEIEQDAIAELDRIHEANELGSSGGNDLWGSGGFNMSPIAAPQAFSPLSEPEVHRRRDEPAAPSSRDLKTLEDLYDAYPEIGNGNYYLRVERKHPTRWGGHYIAGFVCDLHEQISMPDFATRFGGHVYNVSVCGPGRSSTLDGDGRIQARTLTTITIKVPGTPIVTNFDKPDGGSPMSASGGYREDPRVTIKRMEYEQDALRRAEMREQQVRREMASRSALSPDIIEQMNRMADQRAKESRSQASEIISDLRGQISRLSEANQAKEDQIDKLRQQLVHVQTEVQQRLRDEESRQVRELKAQQEATISRLKEDHASRIQQMQQEHERRISEMTERHSRECEQIRTAEARERDRLRDDASRREKNLQDDFTRREAMWRDRENQLKDDFARREDAIRRDYEQRFQQLERSNKRDLEVIKSSESNKSELARQSAEMQMQLHAQEIQRLQSLAEQERNAAAELQQELNKHTNKPLLQQVEETKTIAETLGLLDKKEEPFDWKKGAVNVIKDLVGKGPDIAKSLGEAREQNRMAVARAHQAAQHAQIRAEQQRRRATAEAGSRMVMPVEASTERHVPRPPPPPGVSGPPPQTWDAGPPEPHQPMNLPPEPSGPPSPEPRDPDEPSPAVVPQGPAPPPITGGEGPPVSDDEEPAAAGGAPQQQAFPVTAEQVANFSEQLESAISSGIVSAATFADGFIAQTSPETVLAILQAVGPDQLVDAVAAQDGAQSTAIVTREGRKFVRDLWTEADVRARAALARQQQQGGDAAQPPQPPQPQTQPPQPPQPQPQPQPEEQRRSEDQSDPTDAAAESSERSDEKIS